MTMLKSILAFFFLIYAAQAYSKSNLMYHVDHASLITSVQYSKYKTMAVSSSQDSTIKIWNLKKAVLIKTIKAHRKGVKKIILSPNQKNILSLGYDKVVSYWKVYTGKKLFSFGNSDSIESIGFLYQGDVIVTGHSSGKIKFWNQGSGKLIQEFEGQKAPVLNIDISEDQKFLLATSKDSVIRYWDVQKGKIKRVFKSHKEPSSLVLFDKNNTFFSTDKENIIYNWNINKDDPLKRFKAHKKKITHIYYNTNNKFLISSSLDKTLKFWDLNSKMAISKLLSSAGPFMGFDFKKNHLITATYNLTEWEYKNQNLIKKKELSKSHIVAENVNISEDYNYLHAHFPFLPLMRFNMDKSELEASPLTTHLSITSPDGKLALIIEPPPKNRFLLWNLKKGNKFRGFIGHSNVITAAQFSRDSQFLVTGSKNKSVKMWSINRSRPTLHFKNLDSPVKKVLISKDQKYILAVSHGNKIYAWNVQQGNLIYSVKLTSKKTISDIALSEDSSSFLVSKQKEAILYEIKSGKKKKGWKFNDELSLIRFSPDKRTFMVGTWNGKLLIRSLTTSVQRELDSHVGFLISANYSHDGQIIISSSDDGLIKLWSTKTWENIATLLFDPKKKKWGVINGKENSFDEAKEYKRFYITKGTKVSHSESELGKFRTKNLIHKIIKKYVIKSKKLIHNKTNVVKPTAPFVKFISPNQKSVNVKKPKIVVRLNIIATGGGVKKVAFWHNGKPIIVNNNENTSNKKCDNMNGRKPNNDLKKGKSEVYCFPIKLDKGKNSLLVIATNKKNYSSAPITNYIFH